MENSFSTTIAIILSAVALFIFPLMIIADKRDDIAQSALQSETEIFLNDVRKTGILTEDKIANYESKVQSITGVIMEIEYEIKIFDDNLSRRNIGSPNDEARYYSIFNTQINQRLEDARVGEKSGIIYLKEGDIFSIKCGNKSETLSDSFKRFFYKVTGSKTHTIYTEASGKVLVYGK